jgi:hypothetical protein
MTEGKKAGKKVTIEEAFRRIIPLFIMLMMFPLFGLLAAMAVLYFLNVKNLVILEGLLILSMVIYLTTTILVVRRMAQMVQRARQVE